MEAESPFLTQISTGEKTHFSNHKISDYLGFEHGQDEAARCTIPLGLDQPVRIGNALGNALGRAQRADIEAGEKPGDLARGEVGVDGHDRGEACVSLPAGGAV